MLRKGSPSQRVRGSLYHGMRPFQCQMMAGVDPKFLLSQTLKKETWGKGGWRGGAPRVPGEHAAFLCEQAGLERKVGAWRNERCDKTAASAESGRWPSGSWTLRHLEERITFSSCKVSLPHCAPKGSFFLIQTEASSSLQKPDGRWPGLSSWAVGNTGRKMGTRRGQNGAAEMPVTDQAREPGKV